MAKRRPTPTDVSDAVRDAVDRTVQATIGSAQLTRGRAQDAVDELVRTAGAGAGAVRGAVAGAFEERRPATSEDMKELQAELRRISRRLTAIERQLGDGGGGSTSRAGSGAGARRPKGAGSGGASRGS
jgi:polyhydroxyalkanoate synthesis regulator phasin